VKRRELVKRIEEQVQFSSDMAESTIGIGIPKPKLASLCRGTTRSKNISPGISCESFHRSLNRQQPTPLNGDLD
jgi:hypothetical protein